MFKTGLGNLTTSAKLVAQGRGLVSFCSHLILWPFTSHKRSPLNVICWLMSLLSRARLVVWSTALLQIVKQVHRTPVKRVQRILKNCKTNNELNHKIIGLLLDQVLIEARGLGSFFFQGIAQASTLSVSTDGCAIACSREIPQCMAWRWEISPQEISP